MADPVDMSIYPEDICLAIKRLFTVNPIQVPDEDEQGQKITTVIQPRYIDPEPELAKMTYPSLVFYESSVDADKTRGRKVSSIKIKDQTIYDSQGYPVSVDVRYHPEPMVVLINVLAFCKFDSQRDIIRRTVYNRFKVPAGGLLVKNQNIFVEFLGETNLRVSSTDADKKRRATQWRFKAYTWFDINARTRYYVVRDPIITENWI